MLPTRRPASVTTRAIALVLTVGLGAAGGLSGCGHPEPRRSPAAATGAAVAGAGLIGNDGPPAGVPPSGNVYEHTGAGDLSPAVAGVPARVYVPNTESDSVDVIDPATMAVVDHYVVGRQPQHVTPAWDLKTLYADDDLADTLTPIDPQTGKPGPPIPVADPYNLYFTPDGSQAIVVAERLRRLDFRNPRDWSLTASVEVPYDGVDHLDFSADGSFLLVSAEFSGWIVKVDVRDQRVVSAINVGGEPIDVKMSPDGTVFYVANQARNGVSVIDPVRMREIGFIPTGKGAHGLYPSRDDRSLYVSNRGEGTVSVIDFATGRVVATWAVGGSPDMGGVSADGTQLWLSGRYDRTVYAIDTRSGQVIARIPVGRGPHGLCLFPQPGRYSLGHTGVYR